MEYSLDKVIMEVSATTVLKREDRDLGYHAQHLHALAGRLASAYLLHGVLHEILSNRPQCSTKLLLQIKYILIYTSL